MLDKPAKEKNVINVTAPNIKRAEFKLKGTAPFVMARFSEKAKRMMMEKMAAGSQAKSKKIREARDFDQDVRDALHLGLKGNAGVPAGAFRNAMISACRLVGFKMTLAKLSIFVEADDFDVVDGVPLVNIHGDWERMDMHTRNATGVVDIRCRPMWREWSINLRVKWDGDQFSLIDITHLLMRAGIQVGLGEGRPDSKSSNGLGFGTFEIEGA